LFYENLYCYFLFGGLPHLEHGSLEILSQLILESFVIKQYSFPGRRFSAFSASVDCYNFVGLDTHAFPGPLQIDPTFKHGSVSSLSSSRKSFDLYSGCYTGGGLLE
jgi:hypothetical protein